MTKEVLEIEFTKLGVFKVLKQPQIVYDTLGRGPLTFGNIRIHSCSCVELYCDNDINYLTDIFLRGSNRGKSNYESVYNNQDIVKIIKTLEEFCKDIDIELKVNIKKGVLKIQ